MRFAYVNLAVIRFNNTTEFLSKRNESLFLFPFMYTAVCFEIFSSGVIHRQSLVSVCLFGLQCRTCLINCSQTKFVAIILVLLAFLFLCDFSLDRFFV